MPSFFLRIEGVNLGNSIDDTDDLSTRRGGGLMMLNAVVQLLEKLSLNDLRERLRPIATGASIGLFEFDASDLSEAETIRNQVRDHFRNETLDYPPNGQLPLKHGTFVVDVVPVGEKPAADEQMAVAMNRWQQMQEPSLSLDGLWDGADQPCALDRVRPAEREIWRGEERINVSVSVADRRDYGRNARQRFYRSELKSDPKREFANDFLELSDRGSLEDRVPTNVNDKIAVFYVDGNNFGKIGREKWDNGVDSYRNWSDAIRTHHREILRGLLDRANADPAWLTDSEDIRLDTLLWGGDEIVWVVPAWKGWELAEWFFGQTHKIEMLPEKQTVTYGCGLVFCHSNAPIRHVVALAKKLGDLAKSAGKDTHHLAYEVLESIDDITEDLEDHRRRFLPDKFDVKELVLDPTRLIVLWQSLHKIAASADFPTRQLYRVCKLWRSKGSDIEQKAALKRLRTCEVGKAFEEVEAAFEQSPVAWLHLLQMVPYLPTTGARP